MSSVSPRQHQPCWSTVIIISSFSSFCGLARDHSPLSRPLGDEIRAARPRSTPGMASCHRSRLVTFSCLQLSRAAFAEIAGVTVHQIANPTDVPPSGDLLLCPTDAAHQERTLMVLHFRCNGDSQLWLHIGITWRTFKNPLLRPCPGPITSESWGVGPKYQYFTPR